MNITHCTCHDISFSEISKICESKNYKSLEDIIENENICDRCMMCNPYVECMLETGQTNFNYLL